MQRRRGAHDRDDVGLVDLVGREDRRDDLDLVAEPVGERQRIGRSIMRAVSVAFSDGRDSRLMKPPGSLPAAYMRSSKSTVSGKKSRSFGNFDAVAVTSTMVSP